MEVLFKKSFVKDFEKLPKDIKKEVKEVCLLNFPEIKNLMEFTKYPVSKIKGFDDYYRIRIRNFRVGFKKVNQQIIFMRVLYRKDIYKYFPN